MESTMEIKEILKEYWWLSIITIPVFSFILWLIVKKALGEPIQVGFDGNRSNLVKGIVLCIILLNFGVWGVGTVALGGDAFSGITAQ